MPVKQNKSAFLLRMTKEAKMAADRAAQEIADLSMHHQLVLQHWSVWSIIMESMNSINNTSALARVAHFFRVFSKSFSPRLARHLAYHQHTEQWSMIQFRDGADQFYHSKHRITCSKCQLNQTAQKIWPKFNPDLNSGYQLTDARKKASVYCSSL